MGRFINTGRAPIAQAPAEQCRPPAHIRDAKGYYNLDGSWHQQTCHLGRTQSGKPGLFTGNTLCWPLNPEEHAALAAMPPRELRAYVNSKGFELRGYERD